MLSQSDYPPAPDPTLWPLPRLRRRIAIPSLAHINRLSRMSISEFIASDLRSRIRSGDPLPASLTLLGLANHYSVSMMPVRTAVSALIDEEIIRKEANGRLSISEAAQTGEVRPVTPPPDWLAIIQKDAIHESLKGHSRKWKIDETAEHYGIGRTLVQSLFHRLAGMGVLEHAPRRGWRIRPFRENDLDDYLEIRVLLELKALDDCRERIDPAVIRKILDGNRPGDPRTAPIIDNSLHRYWVDCSGNRYIDDFFVRHGAYYTALYNFAAIGNRHLARIARQHRAVLSAVLDRKWRVAREALTEDIESLRPMLLETIRAIAGNGKDEAESP